MRISSIDTGVITVPLVKTFKTALRSVDTLENVIVTVTTANGLVGYGSAAPSAVITGETTLSITGAVSHISNNLVGMDLNSFEPVLQKLNNCLIGNNSAKAAVDMALYDIVAKHMGVPLYRLLGGPTGTIETDITISLDSPEKMVEESRERISEGFRVLKIKVGGQPRIDIERLEAIHKATSGSVLLRLDANQGWTPKQALSVSRELEAKGIGVELIEQPVYAKDFAGLGFVRDSLEVPVYADESIFSPRDAIELIKLDAVDGINIKLMKCGGIYNGLKIAAIAESYNIPCMIGSMMECNISVTAAAHLAASRSIISRYDLDAPLFCSRNPAVGGISYQGAKLVFPDSPGLGIETVEQGQTLAE